MAQKTCRNCYKTSIHMIYLFFPPPCEPLAPSVCLSAGQTMCWRRASNPARRRPSQLWQRELLFSHCPGSPLTPSLPGETLGHHVTDSPVNTGRTSAPRGSDEWDLTAVTPPAPPPPAFRRSCDSSPRPALLSSRYITPAWDHGSGTVLLGLHKQSNVNTKSNLIAYL